MRRRYPRISPSPWQDRPRASTFPTFEQLGRERILAEKRGALLETLARENSLLRDALDARDRRIGELSEDVAVLEGRLSEVLAEREAERRGELSNA